MINNKDLPKGWGSAPLSQCVSILDSRRIPINTKERNSRIEGKAKSEFIPYYGATGQVGFIDDFLFDEELVLLGEDGAPFFDFKKDTSYMIRGKSWVNNHAHVLRAIAELLKNKFLCHYLNTFDFHGYVTGTTRLKLNQGRMKEMPILLPPPPEQERIVAKIEELFSDLDAGVAALEKVRAEIKRYRQAVLKHAFEGKLTAKWRQKNKDKIEPTIKLLERIEKSRREKWEVARLRQMSEQGKTPKNDKWKNSYKAPVKPDDIELYELPNSWAWTTLGQLAWSVKDGPHYSPKYSKEGIPFISGGNVRPNGVDFDNTKYITPGLHEELSKRCKPETNDILYTKGGTTGIARVNTYDIEFNVWVHVAVLKLTEYVYPFYLQNALNSPFCYSQSQKYTHGVGNQDLGLTRMVKIHLPIPSPKEQKQIVSEIERRFSIADNAEKIVEQALKQAGRLRQSILKRAFEGKLVPQDPNDEPAEKLLERIKAEKKKSG